MSRAWVILVAYAVLAAMAYQTLDDVRFRLATLAILGMFAVRSWVHLRAEARNRGTEQR